jgi:hypothetical protein
MENILSQDTPHFKSPVLLVLLPFHGAGVIYRKMPPPMGGGGKYPPMSFGGEKIWSGEEKWENIREKWRKGKEKEEREIKKKKGGKEKEKEIIGSKRVK